MSRLDELIQQYCPDGVTAVPLGEVAHYAKTRIDASEMNENNYVGVENLLQEKKGKTIASSVPASGAVIAFECGDVLIGNIRPYLKKISLADCNGGTNGDVLTVQINDRSFLMPEFLYYVLSSDQFFLYDMQNSKGAKMPRGSKEAVMKYTIPVPPLPVQNEIVRILDNFTELTAELEAELTARKKQYEFYRDKLLTFGDVRGGATSDVVWRTLGEVASIKTGRKPDNIFETDIGNYVEYINAGTSKSGYVDEPNFSGDTVTTPSRGQGGIGFVGYQKNAFWLGPLCYGIKAKNKEVLSNRYLYHFLCSRTNEILQRKNEGGTPSLNLSDLQAIDICCPSLDVQNRLVDVLDNFDAICSDLKIGLPAEIEARQKQYEYYRDKLLTFREMSNLQ